MYDTNYHNTIASFMLILIEAREICTIHTK